MAEWPVIAQDERARGEFARAAAEEGVGWRVRALLECLGRQGFTAAQAEERVRAVVEEAIAGVGWGR